MLPSKFSENMFRLPPWLSLQAVRLVSPIKSSKNPNLIILMFIEVKSKFPCHSKLIRLSYLLQLQHIVVQRLLRHPHFRSCLFQGNFPSIAVHLSPLKYFANDVTDFSLFSPSVLEDFLLDSESPLRF